MTKIIESKNITLAELKVSEANTRKTDVMAGHEQMLASIAAKGQLTPIIVYPSDKKGMFEISDGQRRFLACQALQEEGHLPKRFTMRCEVISAEEAAEVSLATNVVRVAMHPADEFKAFNALSVEGLSIQEIATRFGVAEKKVEQRLRLANAAPEIFQAYRDGDLRLSELQAYCVTEDQERQISLFQAYGCDHSEYQIRSRLLEETVRDSDPRVRLVTLDKYVEEGGTVTTDLFKESQYLSDIALLDKLAAEKVEEIKKTYLDDGWSWVDLVWRRPEINWSELKRVSPETVELSTKDQAKLDKLKKKLEPLGEQDQVTDEEWDLIDSLGDQIEEIEERKAIYSAEMKAQLGVVLIVDATGDVDAERGLSKEKASPNQKGSKEQDNTKKGYSAKHQDRLAGERTLAMQAFLEQNEEAAEVLLLSELAQSHFGGTTSRVFAGIRSGHVPLGFDSEELKANKAYMALQDVEISWMKVFGEEDADCIQIVTDMEAKERKSLLAFLMAHRLNATNHHEAPEKDTIDRAATVIGGDLSLFWQPSAEGHFRHISKTQIGEDVEDAVGPEEAQKLQGMSKKDMALAAERLTHDSGWLPEPMRTGQNEAPSVPQLQAAE
jgi:ParB family chromosome partitioning protein